MKKIHITEEQLEALKKRINEINLNGDEALNSKNGNATEAAKLTIQNAKDDGLSVDNAATQVSFSHDAMKQNGISEAYEFTTKKDIKEAKIKRLQESCEMFTKRDLH